MVVVMEEAEVMAEAAMGEVVVVVVVGAKGIGLILVSGWAVGGDMIDQGDWDE